MNSFLLELDTTSPTLTITAPQYTSIDIYTSIEITSNEPLENWQEVYIIDSVGIRHDIVLSFGDDITLSGIAMFNDFSIGIGTIYCRLKDVVDNVSSLYSKTINIYENNKISIALQVNQMGCNIIYTDNNIITEINNIETCNISLLKQNISLDVIENEVKMEVEVN